MIKKITVALLLPLLAAAVFAGGMDERLMKAVQEQSIESLQSALELGANPNYCRESDEMTPLMLACHKQWGPGVRFLLKSNARASYKNRYGMTALIIVAANDYASFIVQDLITIGDADPNEKHSLGKNALMYAIENKNQDIIKILLNSPFLNINAVDHMGNNALMYAVKSGDANILTQLLRFFSSKIDFNIRNADGQTVFSLAVASNNLRMVGTLLENGAIDVYEKLPDGTPVLFRAFRINCDDRIIGFIMSAADPAMLLRLTDREGHDIEWYILKSSNTYAQEWLERVKEMRH
ncbi:MAG: ankyrin repeat domain-containing protein [Treponema sp.]